MDSRRQNQVGYRQVFWLPGAFEKTLEKLPPRLPAAITHHNSGLCGGQSPGYSGASAAESHGLPFFGPDCSRDTCNASTITGPPKCVNIKA